MKNDKEKEKKSNKQSLKFFFIQMGVFAGALALASGTTYGIIYLNRAGTTVIDDDNNITLTPAEKLLNSMTDLGLFEIDASLEFTNTKEGISGALDVNGHADITDLSKVKISGDLGFSYGFSKIQGKLGYFDETVYLDYNDSHLKMLVNNDSIGEITEMFSAVDISVSLPDELTTLDLNGIVEDLDTLEPISTPDGGYLFELGLSDRVSIFFISDADYNFTGIKTNKFYYNDIYIYLYGNVNKLPNTTTVTLVNPEKVENAPIYQDFRPALTLIKNMTEFFGEKKNTVNLKVDVDKHDSTNIAYTDLIALDSYITYDTENTKYAIDMDINDSIRHHALDMYLLNDAAEELTLYINHADVTKLSFNVPNVLSVMNYTLNQIDEETLSGLLDTISTGMANTDMDEMLKNLKDMNQWIENISVEDGKTAITLNLSIFGLEMDSFTIYASQDESQFLGISVDNFIYNGYKVALSIMASDSTVEVPSDTADYVNFDYGLGLVPSVMSLIKNDQFRIEFNGDVTNSADSTVAPINIDGGVQFDVAQKYGYGDIEIIDRDKYSHRVRADYATDGTLLLTYNEKMKGKMAKADMTDLVDTVTDVVTNPDDHFTELFGDLLNSMGETPISKVIDEQDYGLIFATKTFSNISISADDATELVTIKANLSGALIGLDDCVMDITLSYNEQGITYLAADNISFGDTVISLEANLVSYDQSLDSSRLSIADTYMDMADLTALLKLGINTSKYNAYHFAGSASLQLDLGFLGTINMVDIPIDIKVVNKPVDGKSNVSIAAELSDIPTISLLNNKVSGYDGTDSRSASLYYEGGNFYLYRYDHAYTSRWWGISKTYYNVEKTCVTDTQGFVDNILYYIIDFMLGIDESTAGGKYIWDSINSSEGESSESTQIAYENVLNDFSYNKDPSNSYFTFDINFEELTKSSVLDQLIVTAGVDTTNDELTYLNVVFDMLNFINLNATIPLTEKALDGDDMDMSKMNTFIEAHKDDTLGQENTTVKKA